MCHCLNQQARYLYRIERQQQYCYRAGALSRNRYFPPLGVHSSPSAEYSTAATVRGRLRSGTHVHGDPEFDRSDDLVSDIVRGRSDHGVQVDRHGQLKITSGEVSRQQHKTALILSRVSRSLELYDFVRILNHRVAVSGDLDSKGGLKEVFPLRHHRTLQKRDSWILIFATPAQAREYQKEASELRHLAARFTSDPSSGMKTSHHLGLQGPRIHDYTLTSPFQSLSLVAQLSPFDFKLQRSVNTQAQLTEERHPGRQTFPVRLWIDKSGYHLNTKSIRTFLELDGKARGSPWRISEKEDAVVRLESYSTSEMSQDDLDEDTESHIPVSIDNWSIDFQHASDAKRFVRAWHRKCLPNLNGLPQAIVKAECLF